MADQIPRTKRVFGTKVSFFLWAGLFLALFLIEFPYLKIPFTQNEGIFTCVAQELRYGAKLYQDVWDHKPPLLFLHFMLIEDLFGNAETAFRCYAIFFHLLDALLLYFLARELFFGKRTAWFIAWSYVLLLFPPFFQAWSLQAELLMQPFLIAAFCFATVGKNWAWTAAGICWAIGFFTKPTAILFLPVFLFLGGEEKLKRAVPFVMAVDATAFMVVLPFLVDGRFGYLAYALWEYNKFYLEDGWSYYLNHPEYQRFVWQWHGMIFLTFGIPFLLTMVFLFERILKAGKNRHIYVFILSWFMTAFISCGISGNFHSYYYFMLVPPLAVGAGICWSRLWELKKTWFFLTAGFALICLMRPWLQVETKGLDGIDYLMDREREAKEMGLYLRWNSRPSDRLWVWASETQIYTYSGLKMAVARTPLVSHLSRMPTDLMGLESAFSARPPDYFVLSYFDQLLAPPEWLPEELRKNYNKVKTLGRYDLFALKDGHKNN